MEHAKQNLIMLLRVKNDSILACSFRIR